MHMNAKWLEEVTAKIQAMAHLPKNWDGEGADVPSPLAIESACRFLRSRACEAEVAPSAVPDAWGGVQVDWQLLGGGEVGFVFRNDGTEDVYVI